MLISKASPNVNTAPQLSTGSTVTTWGQHLKPDKVPDSSKDRFFGQGFPGGQSCWSFEAGGSPWRTFLAAPTAIYNNLTVATTVVLTQLRTTVPSSSSILLRLCLCKLLLLLLLLQAKSHLLSNVLHEKPFRLKNLIVFCECFAGRQILSQFLR